jgi:hypothetical protein
MLVKLSVNYVSQKHLVSLIRRCLKILRAAHFQMDKKRF